MGKVKGRGRVVGKRGGGRGKVKDGITVGMLSYLDTLEKSAVCVFTVHCKCRHDLRN